MHISKTYQFAICYLYSSVKGHSHILIAYEHKERNTFDLELAIGVHSWNTLWARSELLQCIYAFPIEMAKNGKDTNAINNVLSR